MKNWNVARTAAVVVAWAMGVACLPVPAAEPAKPAKPAKAAQLAKPAQPAQTSVVVDSKKVEQQLLAAQAQVVAGNLDAGLKALQEVHAPALAVGLTARVDFVRKLIDARMAEKLGEQAQLLAALADALKQAAQPDQVNACWQVSRTVAEAAVAAKQPGVAGLIDFLSKGPGPAMRQFGPHLEIAKFRVATNNAAAAEVELRNAAQRARSPQDWSAWAVGVTQLATLVDGGQLPQAGSDLFERLREVAKPAGATLDIAKARFLLNRGRLAEGEAAADRAAQVAVSPEARLAVLAIHYDLTLMHTKVGQVEAANRLLAKTEGAAESMPLSAAVATVRGKALLALGLAERAAEVYWKTALAGKVPPEREKMLAAYGVAAVAAGHGLDILPKLQSLKAGPGVYAAVADALAAGGNTATALGVLESLPPQAVVEDAKGGADVAAVMQRIHQQRQQTGLRQVARCRALAAGFEAAAKKAEAAKDAAKAAAHAKQAAAFQALATPPGK